MFLLSPLALDHSEKETEKCIPNEAFIVISCKLKAIVTQKGHQKITEAQSGSKENIGTLHSFGPIVKVVRY